MASAAFSGYAISARWGEKAISFLVKDATERNNLIDAFSKSGPAMIMLSRALPILPEVTACMAGATRMGVLKYAAFFAIGTIPYIGIAAYAGSISSRESPQPAIFAALGLYLALWIGWYIFKRKTAVKQTV